ncbi:DUF6888 family protein [Microcoleus sp. F4-D5]|uniref:DUF6888 family protein n=1 Tax=Microcoleus sp. F4-D5 TaxID=2818760 RepID=UPI0040409BE7
MRLIYPISDCLTYLALPPIHIVCVGESNRNLFVLAGYEGEIEVEVAPDGEFF